MRRGEDEEHEGRQNDDRGAEEKRRDTKNEIEGQHRRRLEE